MSKPTRYPLGRYEHPDHGEGEVALWLPEGRFELLMGSEEEEEAVPVDYEWAAGTVAAARKCLGCGRIGLWRQGATEANNPILHCGRCHDQQLIVRRPSGFAATPGPPCDLCGRPTKNRGTLTRGGVRLKQWQCQDDTCRRDNNDKRRTLYVPIEEPV